MTATANGLHAAGLALEEDIRKMDASELRATPEQRAFLMGAKNALLKQRIAESGGYAVDAPDNTPPAAAEAPGIKGAAVFDPQNLGLADTESAAFDGGEPGSQQAGPSLNGGTP